MAKIRIPRTMSTQHPDNVAIPFFSEGPVIGGDDEIRETYYAFSNIGCTEQMWDYEGKEVDSFVIKKLLSKYPEFFRENAIGRDFFITPRVPNPEFEKSEAKILLETLESVPRSFDTARLFYGRDSPAPIFEIILPMTTSARSLNKIHGYYKHFVGAKGDLKIGSERVSDWIGEFNPKQVSVIPLFEDRERLAKIGRVVKEYLSDKNPPYQRVFLARSDPAMNYGLVGAVILSKIALAKLDGVSRDFGVPIHPIIGVGSCVFRGGLSPSRVKETLKEYPSVETYTIQSAFKYDYSPGEARRGVEELDETASKRAEGLSDSDEKELGKILDKYSASYQKQILRLADSINAASETIPNRRKRKLHVGIWGYSRSVGKKKLPRAIKFTGALYSLGFPPELIAFEALESSELSFLEKFYPNMFSDIAEAAKFADFSKGTFIGKKLSKKLEDLVDIEPEEGHIELSGKIRSAIRKKGRKAVDEGKEMLVDLSLRAANFRKFLG